MVRWIGVEALHASGHRVPVEMLLWSDALDNGSRRFHAVFRSKESSPAGAELVRAQARRLGTQNVFLDAVLAQQSDAVAACDAEGHLTVFNAAARRIHGVEAVPGPAEDWSRRYRLLYDDGQAMRPEDVPLTRASASSTCR